MLWDSFLLSEFLQPLLPYPQALVGLPQPARFLYPLSWMPGVWSGVLLQPWEGSGSAVQIGAAGRPDRGLRAGPWRTSGLPLKRTSLQRLWHKRQLALAPVWTEN